MNFGHLHRPPRYIIALAAIALILLIVRPNKMPVSIAFDPHSETCLPEFNYALLVHIAPQHIQRGDLVFWQPDGELSYVRQEFVLKRVAGIPGDTVDIVDGQVHINGQLISSGMPLASVYGKSVEALNAHLTIPSGAYFLTGSHPQSDDSRYWGLLPKAKIAGSGYALF